MCAVALVFGSLPGAVRGASGASHPDGMTQRASTMMEADRSTQRHPCKRGVAAAPIGACTVFGFFAGLPGAGVDHAPPAVTGAQLGPRPYPSLAHQWRGSPPDRPPRS
jgi:hypothetical protein